MFVSGEEGSVKLSDEYLSRVNVIQEDSVFADESDIETDAVVHKEKDFISLLSCTPSESSSDTYHQLSVTNHC